MRNATIRVQNYGGTWETMGVDRASNIIPENVKYSADQNGCTTASFDLKREPGAVWPDLQAFTPVEIEVDGSLVWSGRIKETPTRESPTEKSINVQCEGWQFHLDDDAYSKMYVHTKMSDFVDIRTLTTTDLTKFPSNLLVNSEGGKITIGGPNGASWLVNSYSGIFLDLGPNNTATRVVVQGYRTAGTGGASIFVTVHSSNGAAPIADPYGSGSVIVSNNALSGISATQSSPTTLSATSGVGGQRYWYIMTVNTGATYTVAPPDNNGDVFIVTNIQLFGSTAYESGNTSILKASTVWADSLVATPNLSSDTSLITTTAFNIPDFTIDQPTTPRAAQDAVNAFHDYQRYVDVFKRLVVRARPSAPLLTAASNAKVTIEDASSNSGEDIYNRVIMTGEQADGSRLYVSRQAGEQSTGNAYTSAQLIESTSPAPTNPSFDTNTTGWVPSVTTITRDTGVFDTSPASGNWSHTNAADNLTGAFTGTFKRGRTYVLDIVMKVTSGPRNISVSFGSSTVGGTATPFTIVTGFQVYRVKWTPTVDTAGTASMLNIVTFSDAASWSLYIDSLRLFTAVPTIPDRRLFQRTKIMPLSFPTTTAAAQQIADTYLSGHLTTPFKGSVSGKGTDAFLDTTSGENVPAHLLTLYPGELIRLPDRVDPDTGAWGREGRIANVDVDLNEDSALVALDNTRSNFEAFLSRLEVVTNTRLGG